MQTRSYSYVVCNNATVIKHLLSQLLCVCVFFFIFFSFFIFPCLVNYFVCFTNPSLPWFTEISVCCHFSARLLGLKGKDNDIGINPL